MKIFKNKTQKRHGDRIRQYSRINMKEKILKQRKLKRYVINNCVKLNKKLIRKDQNPKIQDTKNASC